MSRQQKALLEFLLQLSHHYAMKAQRVRASKGVEHLHTRRLERIAKHLRAAYDGINGEGNEATV